MAITFPNAAKAVGSSVSSVTTSGVTTTTGSTFLISCSRGVGVTATPSDNKGNTYTQIAALSNNSALTVWYCSNGTGGAGHTATITLGTADYPVLHFVELAGAATASYDSGALATNNDAQTITSGTLAQADSAVVSWISSNSGGAQNYAATGYTVARETDGDNYWTSAVGYKAVSSTTAQGITWTGVGGTTPIVIAAFKAAAGGTAYNLTVDPASYSLTAAAETVQVARALTVASTSYGVTAQPVNLAVGRVLNVSPVSYSLSAADVTLTYAAAAKELVIDPANYALSAQPVTVTATRALSVDPASYNLANSAVTLSVGRVVTSNAVSYSLTTSPVTLTVARALSVDPAVYALTAPDVTLEYRSVNPVLSVDPASYVLRSPDVELLYRRLGIQEEVSYPGPSRKKKPKQKWSGVPFTRIYPEVEQIEVIEQAAEEAARLPSPPTKKRAISYLHEYGIYQDHLAKVLIEIERIKRMQIQEREDDEVAAVIACCL